MKRLFITVSIAVFLLYLPNRIQAQTTQTKLNQVELFKQFIGTWKCELAQDTTLIVYVKSYGNGLDYYIKTETKGKILTEGKALMGFDKNSDKGIQAEIMNSPDITLWVVWFTSKNICKTIQYQHISNPESAPKYVLFEFKSPDLLIQTFKENNKTLNSFSFLKER